jgi:hypothetical protein
VADGTRLTILIGATGGPSGGKLNQATSGGDDMAEMLTDDEIASRLRGLAWEREGDEIVREWVRLALTNHSTGGLTDFDFTIAGRFDGL